MSVVKGLKGIQKRQEEDNAPFDGVKYLKLKDGETVRLRFLQELDESAAGYSEKNGLGFLAVEHQVDGNFKNRFLCSIDDLGVCYGCERHQADFKSGNRQKSKLYINVLVERDGEEPQVWVLSQGFGDKSITGTLLEYAGENGTITDQPFKMKRKGSTQTETGYTLISTRPDPEQYNAEQHELFDLNKAVRELSYEEQKELYGKVEPTEKEPTADFGSSEW